MARIGTHVWMAKLTAAAIVLASATAADAAWWTGTYYPTYRTAYYRVQPYYAYYGAAYAPVAAPTACGTCVQRVCSYVPQTTYQVAYRDVPVTSYHPVTTIDHCSGCTWTSYRPVTANVRQAYYLPQTTYRQVCSNVAIAAVPAVAYYAAPAVATAAAPATGACCNGAGAVTTPGYTTPGYTTPGYTTPGYTTPGSVSAPAATSPGSTGIPQPAIEPSEQVPGAGGQSLLNESQSRTGTSQPAPLQPANGWRFGGPAPSVPTPRESQRDRTAMNADAPAYRPVSLSKSAIQPAAALPSALVSAGSASIVPAGVEPATNETRGWRAAD